MNHDPKNPAQARKHLVQIATGLQRVFETLPEVDASGRRMLASNRIKDDVTAVQFATPVDCTVRAWRWEKLGIFSYSVITATTAFLTKKTLDFVGIKDMSLASVLLALVVLQFFPPLLVQSLRALCRVYEYFCCCRRKAASDTQIRVAVSKKLADLVNRHSAHSKIDPIPVDVTADPFVCFVSMMWLTTLRDIASVLEVEQWRLDLWAEIAAESSGTLSSQAISNKTSNDTNLSDDWYEANEERELKEGRCAVKSKQI